MSKAELERRVRAFREIGEEVMSQFWVGIPRDEADLFWREVVDTSDALLEALAVTTGARRQREQLIEAAEGLKEQAEGELSR